MTTPTLRTLLAGTLLLGLSAFQGKKPLALDRPYTQDHAKFERDMADIKREHSLSEQEWWNLTEYPNIAAANKKYAKKGITYRQASKAVDKYFQAGKGDLAPPLPPQ
jgi:hypothetical protein